MQCASKSESIGLLMPCGSRQRESRYGRVNAAGQRSRRPTSAGCAVRHPAPVSRRERRGSRSRDPPAAPPSMRVPARPAHDRSASRGPGATSPPGCWLGASGRRRSSIPPPIVRSWAGRPVAAAGSAARSERRPRVKRPGSAYAPGGRRAGHPRAVVRPCVRSAVDRRWTPWNSRASCRRSDQRTPCRCLPVRNTIVTGALGDLRLGGNRPFKAMVTGDRPPLGAVGRARYAEPCTTATCFHSRSLDPYG